MNKAEESTPDSRIRHYIAERRKMTKISTDDIHGLHDGVEGREAILTVTDILAVLEDRKLLRRACQAALEHCERGAFGDSALANLLRAALEGEAPQ